MKESNPLVAHILSAVGYKLVNDISDLSEFTNNLEGDIMITWVNEFDKTIIDDEAAFPCYIKYQEWVTYDCGTYAHRFEGITPKALIKSIMQGKHYERN